MLALNDKLILSFDVGIRNLAFTVLKIKKFEMPEIMDMGIIDILDDTIHKCRELKKNGMSCEKIASKHIIQNSEKQWKCGTHIKKYSAPYIEEKIIVSPQNRCCRLINKLDLFPQFLNVNLVLIENQHMASSDMQAMAAFIMGYFVMRDPLIEVKYVHAMRKNLILTAISIKCDDNIKISKKDAYKNRKKQSIELCLKYVSEKYANYIKSHSKKDDLSDSYLNAIAFLKSRTVKNLAKIKIDELHNICQMLKINYEKYTKIGEIRNAIQEHIFVPRHKDTALITDIKNIASL